MNLLILTTVYPRGKTELLGNKVHGKFVKDLAKTWVAKGYETHVLTPHSIKTLAYEKLDGVHVHRFHYFFQESWETLTYGEGIPENIRKLKNKFLVPFFAISLWWQALRLIHKHNIDMVNAHWAVPTGYIALWIKALAKIKLVTTIYGAELFPVMAGRMQILKPFLRKAINHADIVVGISQATVEAAKALSGRDDVHVLPDGIDIEYYKPAPKNLEVLEKYNCNGKKVIFFTGRMVERKGHRYPLEAMQYLKENSVDIKLLLGGKGVLFEELKKMRDELGLQDMVEMPGFIPEEDMVPLLQSADAFVLPSCIDAYGDTEGSATIALEAMACGIPAIISHVGGNIGAIEDGRGAFYFESENVEDLAEKISTLLTNNKLAEHIATQARDYIVEHFSWEEIVGKYVDIMEVK